MRYVTEIRAMPRGRKPDGEHALSNAERQARHRARRMEQLLPATTRTRRPIDRRSRPQRWRDAVSELLELQAEYANWFRHYPTACATAPLRRRSKLLPASILMPSPTSNRPAATAAIEKNTNRSASADNGSQSHQKPIDTKIPIQGPAGITKRLFLIVYFDQLRRRRR